MGNMLDYLDWRGDLKFSQDPFNDVDNILCAMLCYIGFSGLVSDKPVEETELPEAAALYFDKYSGKELSLGAMIPASVFDMTRKMAVSPRFGQARLTAYRSEISEKEGLENQLQWTALTLLFEDQSLYISFCGTDDTIVSWKEDLNLALMPEIPSQKAAAEYLNGVAAAYPEYKIRIGGHSKGGNLAVYAAAKCKDEYRDRIVCVYDNDGPGFDESFLSDDGYLSVKERIRDIVPEESFVGLLLCHDLPQTVVKSGNKGLLQHDCFSWFVEKNRFVQAEKISNEALLAEQTVKRWLSGMSPEETSEFVDALYRALTASNARTLTELVGDKSSLLGAYRRLAPSDREVIRHSLRKLIAQKEIYNTVIPTVVGEKRAKNAENREKKKKNYVTHLDGSKLYRPASGKAKKKK